MASLASGGSRRRLAWATTRSDFGSASSAAEEQVNSGAGPTVTARAKPLEDAIDNVKERRSNMGPTPVMLDSPLRAPRNGLIGGPIGETRSIMSMSATAALHGDAVPNVLQMLFRDPSIRPKTLFRDLQFIASFVAVDHNEKGKAFWDAGLAALSLKKEVCQTMIEVADEVVRVSTETRKVPSKPPGGATTTPSSAATKGATAPAMAGTASHITANADGTTLSPNDGSGGLESPAAAYSLADAARMLTITAKEGDPTSQRELALLYLSQPELLERTTLPLSKPREVYKQAIMDKYGSGPGHGSHHNHSSYQGGGGSGTGLGISSGSGGSGGSGGAGAGAGGGGNGPGGAGSSGPGSGRGSKGGPGDVREPAVMCVAIHWMEAAARGGDELARRFMTQI